MLAHFLLKKRWPRWVGLLVATAGLAIALAHALNRSAPGSSVYSIFPNPAVSSTEAAVSSSLQLRTKYDRNLAHYATVSRSDDFFRQMFIDEGAIAAIKPGEPLPNDTLIVMETWYSPETLGTVFVKQKQNGEWRYGSFSPDRPDYRVRFSGSCHSCHAPFPETDFTLTKPLLEAALRSQEVQTAFCDRAGRTPCEPEIYAPNAI